MFRSRSSFSAKRESKSSSSRPKSGNASMKEPRPATISALPFESRSRVANSWNTRTGSAALSTVTALVRRTRRVRAAAAARITVGAESRNSRRWCSPMPKTSRPTSSASVIASSNSLRCRAGSTARPAASTVAATKLSTPISICSFSWDLSLNTLLEQTGEGGPETQKHNDPEHRHDESQRQTARQHQDVNEQNVDDDRSEQGQREWDVAIDQEQDRRNDLEQKYRDQIVRDEKRADELAGGPGRRRSGNEVKEAVQSEREKDQTEQETGNDNSCFHVKIVYLL